MAKYNFIADKINYHDEGAYFQKEDYETLEKIAEMCNKDITKFRVMKHIPVDGNYDFSYCLENGKVKKLILRNQNLKEIKYINELESLVELDLSHNYIMEINNLPKNLTHLYLNYNLITEIKNLPESLTKINLVDNHLYRLKILPTLPENLKEISLDKKAISRHELKHLKYKKPQININIRMTTSLETIDLDDKEEKSIKYFEEKKEAEINDLENIMKELEIVPCNANVMKALELIQLMNLRNEENKKKITNSQLEYLEKITLTILRNNEYKDKKRKISLNKDVFEKLKEAALLNAEIPTAPEIKTKDNYSLLL